MAKYITCPKGAILDIAVDLRRNSSTFGMWDSVILSEQNGKSAFLSPGLGHAFVSLKHDTTVEYLCSAEYLPNSERTVNIFSKALSINLTDLTKEFDLPHFIQSARDREAQDFELIDEIDRLG